MNQGEVLAMGTPGRGAGDPAGGPRPVSGLGNVDEPATVGAGMSAASDILALANVESSYGPIRPSAASAWRSSKGQIATVLGSNGAGKTTILKTISGIIDPRKGSGPFQGARHHRADPAHRARRGPEPRARGREVFPLLSVHDNLLMGAYTRRPRRRGARHRDRLRLLPHPRGAGEGCRAAVRRPAADAGHRARADGPAGADAARRAQPGPVAAADARRSSEIIVVRINRERGTTILLVEQNANMALNAADYGYVLETAAS